MNLYNVIRTETDTVQNKKKKKKKVSMKVHP